MLIWSMVYDDYLEGTLCGLMLHYDEVVCVS